MVGNKVSGADGGLSARGAIEYAPKGFGTSSRYRLPLLGFLVLQIRWLPVLQFRREELCDHRKLLGREDEASRSRNFDPNGAAGRAGKILNRALPSTPDFELVYRLKQAPRIRKGTTRSLERTAAAICVARAIPTKFSNCIVVLLTVSFDTRSLSTIRSPPA